MKKTDNQVIDFLREKWNGLQFTFFKWNFEWHKKAKERTYMKNFKRLEQENQSKHEKKIIKVIKNECIRRGLNLNTQIAYVLATVEWETAGTFRPVKEAYWLSEDWRKKNLRYYPYYGRGYVQITWKRNYKKYSKKLNMDLVKHPDKVMEPKIALYILVDGFKLGTFTGKKLEDYVNHDKTDFINARRCINGIDKAHKIAKLAVKYLKEM